MIKSKCCNAELEEVETEFIGGIATAYVLRCTRCGKCYDEWEICAQWEICEEESQVEVEK
jgi:uncharacterized Fe-S cluster-containing radical SAM superfamily protein